MTATCKNCGESLWLHRELDFSNVWQEGDTCEEFEKNMSEEKIKLPVRYDPTTETICEVVSKAEIAHITPEGWASAQDRFNIGNQIADALNTTADLREKLRIAEDALRCADAVVEMIGVPRCDDFNHSKVDGHTMNEDCPVVQEFYLHRAKINKALAGIA